MPTYDVDVEGKTYEVDAPDSNTAWAWAYTTHQQQFGTKPVAPPPEPKEGFGQSLVRGFKAYAPQLQESIGGLGVLAGKGIQEAFGPGEVSAGLMKSGMERMKAADEQQKAMMRQGEGSFTQALDKGLGTVLTEWLPYQVGSGAANLLESLALMGAGTAAGTLAAPGVGSIAGGVTAAVSKELAKKGVLEAAKKIAVAEGEEVAKKFVEKAALDAAKDIAIKRGQTAFLAGQAAGYGFGQVTSRAVQEAQERGEAPDAIELSRVLPAGLVSTAAEFLSDKIGLGALKGLKKESQDVAKDVAAGLLTKSLQKVGDISKGILVTGTKEAPTEIIQQAAERFGAKLNLSDAEALREYMDAAAAAYAMSVVPGGIGGLRQKEVQKTAQQQYLESLPEAERETARARMETAEPQKAEAESPKPITGEAGIVRPEEEVSIPEAEVQRRLEVAKEEAISPEDEVQQRLRQAAAEGEKEKARRQDEARQVVLTRALQNIEERGGIASPEEARVVDEANIGQPYDRIDEGLGRTLSTDERLTEATGILVGRVAETMPEAPIPPKKTLEEVTTPERLVPSGLTEEEITRRQQQARGEVAPEAPPEGTPPEVAPTREKQPPVTSYEQFLERLPEAPEVSAVREANDAGNFRQLIGALKQSENPVIQRIGELGEKIASKTTLRKPGVIKELRRAAGVYHHADDSIQMNPKYAGSEQVNAHETLHALVAKAQRAPTAKQAATVKKIELLYQHVKRELAKQGIKPRDMYGLKNQYEFVAEAMSDPQFQYTLMQIPYKGKQSAWSAFVQMVADLLGIDNTNALTEVMALTEKLAQMQTRRRKTIETVIEAAEAKPEAAITEEAPAPSVKPEPTYRGQVGKETPPTPTTAGQQALDTINQLDMGVKPPEPNLRKKVQEKLERIGEAPTKESMKLWKTAISDFFAKLDGQLFSADAPFENKIRQGKREDFKSVEEFMGTMLAVSQSQAVGPDAVATQAMLIGKPKYRKDVYKWIAVKDEANEVNKAKILDGIASKYGLTKEEAIRVSHTYLAAANYEGIIKRNAENAERIKALRDEGKSDEAAALKVAEVYVTPKQAAMVEPGLAIANQIPEVKQITELWNKQRENVKNVLVETGLWTPGYADAMMDNAAYVPFYREMEDEADASPEMMMRGLQVKAKEHKLKGSAAPVADVFENMAKWQQYAINRAIRNHKAVQMINVAKKMKLGDEPMAKEVSDAKKGKNVVRVWEDGKQKFYEMKDPLFMDAFKSLGAVSIPTIKYFTAIADLLRRSIVMYPMFSVGQVPQDAVAAIFASGLQPRYAFKIPFYAVKEAIQTYRGMSNIHDELKNFGAVGVRDFNAVTMRQDAEITAGLKIPRGGMEKVKYFLERIAMSADNAVRQAVYQAAMEQPGVTQAEALEKAFEIINFRRRGSSKMVNLIGQTVPFFYAYLSAQRVAYKTLTGIGISPTERKAALETLAYTSAAVMALSFIYAMANGDDEDYEKVPSNVRDRSIIIPGTGGLRIPLRPDFFLFPKIIAEHTYHLMADNGFSDPAKFKRAMRDNFVNSATSPNVVPQIIKPAFEIGINYDFFQGKPIIGFFEQNKDASRQFTESTSEFGKFMGGAGLSPQKVDHFVRGYFGTVGGLFLWTTNFMMEGEPGVPRPELSWHDVAATMPGVGAFKQKSTENALKVDFYELRDAVEKAKNTYDDIKKRSPEGLKAFVENEENYAKLALEKKVTHVAEHLSKIRKAIQQVSAAPEGRYTAEEKQERIEQLREVELRYLKAIDLKGMREKAMM